MDLHRCRRDFLLQAGGVFSFSPLRIIIPVASSCCWRLWWSQREFVKSGDDWREEDFPLMDEFLHKPNYHNYTKLGTQLLLNKFWFQYIMKINKEAVKLFWPYYNPELPPLLLSKCCLEVYRKERDLKVIDIKIQAGSRKYLAHLLEKYLKQLIDQIHFLPINKLINWLIIAVLIKFFPVAFTPWLDSVLYFSPTVRQIALLIFTPTESMPQFPLMLFMEYLQTALMLSVHKKLSFMLSVFNPFEVKQARPTGRYLVVSWTVNAAELCVPCCGCLCYSGGSPLLTYMNNPWHATCLTMYNSSMQDQPLISEDCRW